MQASHETISLYNYLHSKKELKDKLISELQQKRKYRCKSKREVNKSFEYWIFYKRINILKNNRLKLRELISYYNVHQPKIQLDSFTYGSKKGQ